MHKRFAELQVNIHLKDITRDEDLIETLEAHCRNVLASFPEVTHLELSAEPAPLGVEVHTHTAGRRVDLAAHASGSDLRATADQALAKLGRELRRHHDKRIFTRRREAQRHSRHHAPDAGAEAAETY